jgi:predicted  nucleic acid-binding Zn-ribbon protein
MKNRAFFILPLGLVVLSNCTGTTDPGDATVFDNIANLSSGEYDRQLATKEAEAQAIINANNATQARITNLDAQRASNASTIASLQSQVASVRAEIAAARSRASGNAAATAQLANLEGQLSAVQRDVSSGGDAGIARAELSRIRSAVRALST